MISQLPQNAQNVTCVFLSNQSAEKPISSSLHKMMHLIGNTPQIKGACHVQRQLHQKNIFTTKQLHNLPRYDCCLVNSTIIFSKNNTEFTPQESNELNWSKLNFKHFENNPGNFRKILSKMPKKMKISQNVGQKNRFWEQHFFWAPKQSQFDTDSYLSVDSLRRNLLLPAISNALPTNVNQSQEDDSVSSEHDQTIHQQEYGGGNVESGEEEEEEDEESGDETGVLTKRRLITDNISVHQQDDTIIQGVSDSDSDDNQENDDFQSANEFSPLPRQNSSILHRRLPSASQQRSPSPPTPRRTSQGNVGSQFCQPISPHRSPASFIDDYNLSPPHPSGAYHSGLTSVSPLQEQPDEAQTEITGEERLGNNTLTLRPGRRSLRLASSSMESGMTLRKNPSQTTKYKPQDND